MSNYKGTIGILTGGGDVPGLNPAIRAVTYRALREGYRVIGIRRGWAGLVDLVPDKDASNDDNFVELSQELVNRAARTGGTFLHTSRTRPSHLPKSVVPPHLAGEYSDEINDVTPAVLRNLEFLGIDHLIPIGGDDTLSYAQRLHEEGVSLVAIPKTMDNDVPGTDYCIGFSTCVTRTIEMTRKLRTSAGSHERFLVIEVFGRYAGFTALLPTMTGAADRCVIPEQPFEIDHLTELLAADRKTNASRYAVVLVSEGAKMVGGDTTFEGEESDQYGHRKLGGIGDRVSAELKERSAAFNNGHRINIVNQRLGYLVRCGEPDAVDSIVPMAYGNLAFDLILSDRRHREALPRRSTATELQELPSHAAVHHDERGLSMTAEPIRRIGMLTGGGDCPGLNAVIRAVAKTAIYKYGVRVFGIEDGFQGLVDDRVRELKSSHVSGILTRGGTILGTNNRCDPSRYCTGHDADGNPVFEDMNDQVAATIARHELDAIVVIGGDGTMSCAAPLVARGVRCVGVPKTIDNDLVGTEITFGFLTAVSTATEAIDKLHSTAESHHRCIVCEVMGRNAGWIALTSGVASGADVILLPEIPYEIDRICAFVTDRARNGPGFSIIVCAEGARPRDGELVVSRIDPTSPDPIRLGGIGAQVAADVTERTGIETRTTVLGHVQRGGPPVAADRILATGFGYHAMELVMARQFGRLVVRQNHRVTDIDLMACANKQRLVPMDDPLIAAARAVRTSFGDAR
jgi:6-phosphofructokinase 1